MEMLVISSFYLLHLFTSQKYNLIIERHSSRIILTKIKQIENPLVSYRNIVFIYLLDNSLFY